MGKKSILYIMGIDWNWIYQRPQIFAEKLAQDYQVTVLFPRSIMKWREDKQSHYPVNYRILWTIPYQEKSRFVGFAARWLNHRKLRDINDFDYIYVGYPLYARYIPEGYPGKIIYDCMDNHEALYPDRKRVAKVIREEQSLITMCDLLVVSSRMLEKKVNAEAGFPKAVIIRNAVKVSEVCQVKPAEKKSQYRLCYIGTISEWFDYDLLRQSLEKNDRITYRLIGPAAKIIEDRNIIYKGIVQHEMLSDAIKEYDCLIMPFRINDIVAAVDPVKLYEYVAFGKCIISVYYPEVQPFEEFVYFYRDVKEYVELLEVLADSGFPPKYNEQQQKDFLSNNTWKERYSTLKNCMEAMEGQNEG